MGNFKAFKTAVGAQFALMQTQPDLYRTDVDKNALWETYLASFPQGTNEMYRERTEHDCSCCKSFIRSVGDVVAVIDGKVVTLWDVSLPGEPAYQTVADTLVKIVRAATIKYHGKRIIKA